MTTNVTVYDVMKTAGARAFLIVGRARPDRSPSYASHLKMTGLSAGFGDITNIEIPDPKQYGNFLVIDRLRGANSRLTTSLVGKYASKITSQLLSMAKSGWSSDVQLHIGSCQDPSASNQFDKAIVLEDVVPSQWSTDDLGALASGENATVNETLQVSAANVWEVVPLSFAERAGDVVTNQVMDIKFIDQISAGECLTQSMGSSRIFAISKQAGGSPSTPADIVFSLDGGATWKAHDVDTGGATEDMTSVVGIGDYIVVFSNTGTALYYALKSDFEYGGDPSFSKVTTGILRGINHAWSTGRLAFAVGDYGYIYSISDPTAGATALDAGVATISKLNAVHAYDDNHAVAVGNDGAVIFTTNQVSWTSAPSKPVGIGVHLLGVWMLSKEIWYVTTSNGKLYYTLNGGITWVLKGVPGTAPTKMCDIRFSTPSIGACSGVVSSHGRIYRTIDGGQSWYVTPESGSIPVSDEFTRIALSPYEPNIIAAGGLGDNGTDGIIAVGTGS